MSNRNFDYLQPVEDPMKYITDNLNAKQSRIRGLIGKMNQRKNKRGNDVDSLLPAKMALSPYEGVMLRKSMQQGTDM